MGLLSNTESGRLLKTGFAHSAHWAHPVAALFAFASDVVKPILPHCTPRVLEGALALLACLLVLMRFKKITAELGATLITFCVMTAVLSVAVIGLQKIVHGEQDGAFATLSPGIAALQEKLGLVETTLESIQQKQVEGQAQGAAWHEEYKEGYKALSEQNRETHNALSEQNKMLVEVLAREKGVPIPALVQILARLGETVISNDPAEVQRRLEQKANEYVELRQHVLLLSGDDPQIRALQHEADVALGNADFALARAKLREAAEIDAAASRALADRAKGRALAAAQTLEKSARVATLTLHYRDAADDLAKAVAL